MVTEAEVLGLEAELDAVRTILNDLERRISEEIAEADVWVILGDVIEAEGRAAVLTGRYIDTRPSSAQNGDLRRVNPGFSEVFAQAHGQRDRAMETIRRCYDRLRKR